MNIKPITKEQLKRLPDKIEKMKWIRAYNNFHGWHKNFHGWSEKPPVFVSSNPNAPTNNP